MPGKIQRRHRREGTRQGERRGKACKGADSMGEIRPARHTPRPTEIMQADTAVLTHDLAGLNCNHPLDVVCFALNETRVTVYARIPLIYACYDMT